jgi:cellulose synthase/poly-beta-1,6-N-acetylglucosamine synthase-like glycosyltransferase
MKKQAIIIIPAYNEENNIAGVINGIKNVIPDADILVVNDGGEEPLHNNQGQFIEETIKSVLSQEGDFYAVFKDQRKGGELF